MRTSDEQACTASLVVTIKAVSAAWSAGVAGRFVGSVCLAQSAYSEHCPKGLLDSRKLPDEFRIGGVALAAARAVEFEAR